MVSRVLIADEKGEPWAEVTTDPEDGGSYAACRCGWSGERRWTYTQDALEEAGTHVDRAHR